MSKTRKFGRLNWHVSEVGHGMWGMGSWSDSNDDASMEALQLSVDLGCNFFDTAFAYGDGRSEALLGQLLKQNPDKKLFTATKIPPKNKKWPSKRGYLLDDCFPADHIREFVEKSLSNAGIGSFDLVQFHVWEDDWATDERWIRAMSDLKAEGLIHASGISINRWEPWNGIKTVKSGHIDSVQVIYNLFDQNPEDELLPVCREHDVAVIARVPFDEGTLTGNLTVDSSWPKGDWRNTYFVPQNLIPSVERAEKLKQLLPGEMTLPELALRFILSNQDITTVIPGMRALRHVRSNIACSDKGPLEPSLLETLKQHRWDRMPSSWSH